MARKFSIPEVAALEVGQRVTVNQPASAIRRKVFDYGKRNGKEFALSYVQGESQTAVTREPDSEPQS